MIKGRKENARKIRNEAEKIKKDENNVNTFLKTRIVFCKISKISEFMIIMMLAFWCGAAVIYHPTDVGFLQGAPAFLEGLTIALVRCLLHCCRGVCTYTYIFLSRAFAY